MKPSRPAATGTRASTWLEQEAPLGRSLRTLGGRLLRRGRASWFLWAPLALVVGAVMARSSARHVVYSAQVVLWATAGRPETTADSDAGMGKLRGYIREWAFTGDHLLEVMGRYEHEFPGVSARPAEAIESMRRATEVKVASSDFIEDRAADDPPPSARITVGYTAATPELALALARELARLVVSSALSRQGEIATHAAAGTAAALKKSETSFEETFQGGSDGTLDRAQLGSALRAAEAARAGLRAAVIAATDATLASRTDADNGTIRFNVVDWGQAPPLRSKALFAEELIALFSIGLLASCLLAGAFDPRILDRSDLTDAGLTVLGQVPRLPSP